MSDAVENLILDLLEWVDRKERTYQETLEAWRTSCPRLPVWEEATDRGLLVADSATGRALVRGARGLSAPEETRKRPCFATDAPDRALKRQERPVCSVHAPAPVATSGAHRARQL